MTSFDNTLGAAFIGGFLTAILYGITCVQCFMYFQNSSKEERTIRRMVAMLWAIDTVHITFVAHSLYWYLVSNFTNAVVVGQIPWSITAGILVTPTSDTIVRYFFTWRIWILSKKNKLLVFPLILLVAVIFVIGLAFAIKGFSISTFEKFAKLAWLLYLGLGLLVVGDGYIAISLVYLLARARSSMRRTDSIVNVLIMYTIQTGSLTSVFSLACFITYAALPKTYIFLALYFPLSKLYANALLATLNARGSLRDRVNTSSTQIWSAPLSTLMARSGKTQQGASAGMLSVQVDTDIHVSDNGIRKVHLTDEEQSESSTFAKGPISTGNISMEADV